MVRFPQHNMQYAGCVVSVFQQVTPPPPAYTHTDTFDFTPPSLPTSLPPHTTPHTHISRYTQYIPLSMYELQTWLGTPCIYVLDCSAAGLIINSFRSLMDTRQQQLALQQQQVRLGVRGCVRKCEIGCERVCV